jgi:hypothetical protein
MYKVGDVAKVAWWYQDMEDDDISDILYGIILKIENVSKHQYMQFYDFHDKHVYEFRIDSSITIEKINV